MFEDIFSRRNTILKKMIEYFINDYKDLVLESVVREKDIDLIFKGIILFSKISYLGIYSLEHKKKLLTYIKENKKEDFLKNFLRYNSSFLKKYNLEKFLRLEILTLSYLYEKSYFNAFFILNEESYIKAKTKIYLINQEDLKTKYFNHRNTIIIKKGKKNTELDIQEILFKLYSGKKIEFSIKNYILKYYLKEYTIVSEFLKYHKN